jgi:type 1 fimbriae regulatory protein FimB/type 1 fimbriae regulatory protein FimE
MAKPRLKLVLPAIEKRIVMPTRAKNTELRTREYLTQHEVETLMDGTPRNRYGHRDATMILVAFRHELRASEVVDLRWDQVDFNRAVLHVRRAKHGTPSVHPVSGPEMRAPLTARCTCCVAPKSRRKTTFRVMNCPAYNEPAWQQDLR